jgi:transcriptional regulator with XRE-family HTH domain
VPPKRRSKPRSPGLAALGQAIELLIAEDADMSKDSVADEAGLSIEQLGRYIRGQGNPTYRMLERLCEGLHVNVVELMTLAEELRERRTKRHPNPPSAA